MPRNGPNCSAAELNLPPFRAPGGIFGSKMPFKGVFGRSISSLISDLSIAAAH